MKVADLIEKLLQIDQELDVIMASDAEGNSYSPFAGFSIDQYVAENTWSGYLVSSEDVEDSEWEPNAVVLWAVN